MGQVEGWWTEVEPGMSRDAIEASVNAPFSSPRVARQPPGAIRCQYGLSRACTARNYLNVNPFILSCGIPCQVHNAEAKAILLERLLRTKLERRAGVEGGGAFSLGHTAGSSVQEMQFSRHRGSLQVLLSRSLSLPLSRSLSPPPLSSISCSRVSLTLPLSLYPFDSLAID